MRRTLLLVAVALISLFMLAAIPVNAKDRGRGHKHRKWVRHTLHRHADDGRIVVVRDRERIRRRHRDRGSVVVVLPGIRVNDFDHRPPGWDRGRKVGWGNCDVPPGLAKKIGCRSHNRLLNRRVILRDRHHRRDPSVVIRIPFVGSFRLR